jgi:hypothetical protein
MYKSIYFDNSLKKILPSSDKSTTIKIISIFDIRCRFLAVWIKINLVNFRTLFI